ncbi:MAG: response regulator [Pseudomonadota bacterium]
MAKRILLVEDEPHIVEALSFVLMKEGFSVTVQSTGEGVLDRLASISPDLVILDYMLPGQSGLQILTEMRETERYADTPVLMLTAKGQTKDRAAAENAGVSRFMTKPFANSEIVAVAKELTRR